jgi:hypothetical protein
MLKKIFKYLLFCISFNLIVASLIIYFAIDIISYPKSFSKQCDIALVEGWIYDEDLNYFANQLKKYNKIYVIGDKIDRGIEYFPYDNFAELTKDRLNKKGITKNKIISLKTSYKKNHTFNTIKELSLKVKTNCLDVYTTQEHSRRTYFAINKNFKNIKINIFYNEKKELKHYNWLKYSNSFKHIIMEIISVFYTYINYYLI